MKKKFSILTLALCLMLGAVGCSNNSSSSSSSNASSAASSSGDSSEKVELNISAAASLQEAMVELEKEFKNINPDVKLTVNLGSSGSLMQQILPCIRFLPHFSSLSDKRRRLPTIFVRISVAGLYYIEFLENMQAYSCIFDTFSAFDAILRVLLSYVIIVSN